MTERDRELLINQMKGTAANVEEFARQINAGENGNRWTVTDDDGNEHVTIASDEDQARTNAESASELVDSRGMVGEPEDWGIERDSFDVPTIVDEYGNETSIDEYPLEVIDERGREFAVVLTTGGPHLEVVADGGQSARFEGYWGGEKYTMHGDYFDTFLEYFIDRD